MAVKKCFDVLHVPRLIRRFVGRSLHRDDRCQCQKDRDDCEQAEPDAAGGGAPLFVARLCEPWRFVVRQYRPMHHCKIPSIHSDSAHKDYCSKRKVDASIGLTHDGGYLYSTRDAAHTSRALPAL